MESLGEAMNRFSEHMMLRKEEKKTKNGNVALDTRQPFMNRLGQVAMLCIAAWSLAVFRFDRTFLVAGRMP